MITYRSFRNDDPPRLLKLWHDSELGRGAARPSSTDAFEISNYCQSYFDRDGLILACEGSAVVGLVHAGFGCSADLSRLDPAIGVISAILVRPSFRRQGIGRELIRQAEEYLRSHGATEIFGGPSKGRDPFYFGLYGGSRPSGFLLSDPAAAPFFTAVGYEPVEQIGVYQRDLSTARDPTSFRIVNIRRQTQLEIADQPYSPTWWWYTHFGRMDSLRFRLVMKTGGTPIAAVTVIGLDHYLPVWNERTIGLVDMFVDEAHRGKGYGQTLLIEVLRRLRQELVTRAEIHASENHGVVTRAIAGAGFTRVDTGVVYRRRETAPDRD